MIEPAVSLALTLESNPGAYACLLGSGVSATSGIPTGWGIVVDLIRRVARSLGEEPADDPAAWYRNRYAEEPDYSKLLDQVARAPTERARLLRSYFEATEEERAKGLKQPTPAHRALASLARQGILRVFVTTNFDRLLERALEDEHVVPVVISSADGVSGVSPLTSGDVTVIKVNGDYLDTRIKNTPEELASYEPPLRDLLDRILDEFGMLIAGWSGQWDTALIEAFERCPTHRYCTYWAARHQPKGSAAKIMALRKGHFIQVDSADRFFTELVCRLDCTGLPASLKPRGASAAHPHNLPSQVSSFVGRGAALDELDRLLDHTRLLTLHGAGGTGKTRAALELGHRRLGRHPDGVWFTELVTVEPDRVIPEIAQALNVAPERVQTALAHRDALLIVDGCERVRESVASVMERLLKGAPKLRVVTTSRARLGVPGEAVYSLEPLRLPSSDGVSAEELQESDAAQLFVDRARDVDRRFQVTNANSRAVARIVRQLDGIPLALELAAAQTRTLPVELLADRLEDAFKMLRKGQRGALPQQSTLRGVWDWSWQLLTEEERRLFERLSVFRGGFSLQAAEAVAADDQLPQDEILYVLTELIDKAMVSYEPASQGRYALLELPRQYAALRLEERGETARFERAHARWHLDRIRTTTWPAMSSPDVRGGQATAWVGELLPDLDNFRVAAERLIEQGDPVEAVEFVTSSTWLWWYRRLSALALSWILRARQRANELPPMLDAFSLFSAGLFGAPADAATACVHLEGAARKFEALGMKELAMEALAFRAVAYVSTGDFEGIVRVYDEVSDWYDAHPRGWLYPQLPAWHVGISLHRGDLDAALADSAQALRHVHANTNPNATYVNLFFASCAHRAAGELSSSNELAERALRVAEGVDNGRMAAALHQLAVGKWLQGDLDVARGHALRARDLYSAISPPDLVWMVNMGRIGTGTAGSRDEVLSEYEALFRLPPRVGALRLIVGKLDECARLNAILGGKAPRIEDAAQTARAELKALEGSPTPPRG